MAEFILPVSVPGAQESAAKLRTFKTEAVGAAAATDAAAEAATALGKAHQAAGQSTATATAHERAHIRTLDEEIARLKALEHQTAITAKARLALGESGNAGDVSALRRFARQLPGGIGKEIGRGAVEGYEGSEGQGLKATLGTLGAALAATYVGFELAKAATEASAEAIHHEIEQRGKLADLLEAGQRSAAKGGDDYLRRNGSAMREIVANGGDAALDKANKFSDATKDPTAMAAFADLSKRLPAKFLQQGLDIATQEHELGGGSLESVAKKLNLQRLERQTDGDQIVREDLGDTENGVPLTAKELSDRRANLRDSKSLSAVTDQENDDAKIDRAARGHVKVAKAESGAAVAKAVNPTMDTFLAKQSADGFGESEELRAKADDELKGRGLSTPISTSFLALQEWAHRHGFGKGSFTQQFNESNAAASKEAGKAFNKDSEMSGLLRDAAASLSAAADLHDSAGSGSAGQSGAAP